MRDERPRNLVDKDVDITQIKPCAACGGKLSGQYGHNLNVYRVTIDSLIIDPNATRSFTGLSMMLGGSMALAGALSPDRKLLKCFGSDELIVCFDCYCDKSLAHLAERAQTQQDNAPPTSDGGGEGGLASGQAPSPERLVPEV